MAKELLALFDGDGRRTSTVLKGTHYQTAKQKQVYIDKGYIQISENDWQYYIGNHGAGKNGTGYIRDAKTGKPVDAPPRQYTKKEKAEILYNECQSDLKQIDAQLLNATVIGDDELVKELRQERADRIKQYQKDLAELEGGE